MRSIGYLYPEWMAAKRGLTAALLECKDSREIALTVEQFFKAHVFEVGQNYRISRIELDHSEAKDIVAWHERKAGMLLGETLLSNGLYHTETTRWSDDGVEKSFRVLVFGAPQATVPGTRVRRDAAQGEAT